MPSASIIAFPNCAPLSVPLLPRFTREEHNAIIAGVIVAFPSWGVSIHDSDNGDVASIGAVDGGSDRRDAENSYGIAFVSGRRVEVLDLHTWDEVGTFPTVAEAVAAMQAHATSATH